MKDKYNREIDYIRISVTDRCNLRCVYCMPEEGVEMLSHSSILSYEEMLKITKCLSELGIKKVRLTGGEPLVRRGIVNLIEDIKSLDGIETVSITTNGILFCDMFGELKAAGLDEVNFSLDTLQADRFEKIARRPGLEKVLAAIDLSEKSGLKTKVNCVAMNGVNDDEILDMVGLIQNRNICLRFIEYMPVGKHDLEKAVPTETVMRIIEEKYGELIPDERKHGMGPAKYYRIPDVKGSVGFISAMTNCFCDSCNRIRLTAEGFLKLCLQYNVGISLRDLMRNGATDDELKTAICDAVQNKPQRHTFNDYMTAENIEENGMSRIGG